jgi:hypothetical protein
MSVALCHLFPHSRSRHLLHNLVVRRAARKRGPAYKVSSSILNPAQQTLHRAALRFIARRVQVVDTVQPCARRCGVATRGAAWCPGQRAVMRFSVISIFQLCVTGAPFCAQGNRFARQWCFYFSHRL